MARESRLVNRNVLAGRGRTSMRLEPELWNALAEICDREQTDLGNLIRNIEANGRKGGRTSAVRVHIIDYFRRAARRDASGRAEADHDPEHARHPAPKSAAAQLEIHDR